MEETLEKPVHRKKFLKQLAATAVAAVGAGVIVDSAQATDVIYQCCTSSCASCNPGVYAYFCTPQNTNLCDSICWGCDPNHGINCWTLTQPGC
jgi:hypothetical protein